MIKQMMAAFMAISLAACANSALTVEEPNRSSYKTQMLTVEAGENSVGVDDGAVAYTRRRLEEELFKNEDAAFAQGDGMTVRFRYVGFNKGSRRAAI